VVDVRLATVGLTAALGIFPLLVRGRHAPVEEPSREVDFASGIVLEISEGASVRFERKGRTVLLGRAPNADVRLADAKVSRLHARIEARSEGTFVEDLQSRNGTFKDGSPVVGRIRLEPGDRLTLGEARVVYRGLERWT
jgi:pSer/pThr/pTyr-binding forkhead associated (FHA) protein